MLEYLSIGVILKPQGLKGEIKIKPLTDDMGRFEALTTFYIKDGQGYKDIKVQSCRMDKSFVYLRLQGYDTIESVEPLRDQYLWVPRSQAIKLPRDTFFIADLIGCNVITKEGKSLGSIRDIIQTGSNDVYVVKGDRGDVLIPALKKVIVEINIQEGRVAVDLTELEGLIPDEY